MKGEIVDVVREIRDVTTQLGIAAAREEEFERGTTKKGFTFEDVLDECVGRLAAQHGDLHERCGTETGATGSKVGDEVVTLNLADSYGVEARFVFEAKDRKLAMRKILAELDEAMANREAQFAIGVFRSQENRRRRSRSTASVRTRRSSSSTTTVTSPCGSPTSGPGCGCGPPGR